MRPVIVPRIVISQVGPAPVGRTAGRLRIRVIMYGLGGRRTTRRDIRLTTGRCAKSAIH